MKNNKVITTEKVNQIKALIGTQSLNEIGRTLGISVSTVLKVKHGCYDTGKLVYKYEKVTEKGMFNSTERKNWLI